MNTARPRLTLDEMARLERKRANMEREVSRLKPNSGARERAARRLVDFILGEWGQAFGTPLRWDNERQIHDLRRPTEGRGKRKA